MLKRVNVNLLALSYICVERTTEEYGCFVTSLLLLCLQIRINVYVNSVHYTL